ncbi:hypothetical protein [Celeribacter marinus]|uniref:Uncharacterized protein n=1 Tax=Celeribacter marinus TaxID=1397108 RepID=A0A0P0A9E9_9RHOB|nr:hypothetical protein [Celeribacter marinus]ALI54702.1 hypothetical protein IMCC12053_754 [Celeribacter marinus]SFK53800.1 hypothetical protein SAMN05444421_105122 [Celeribacter marinus]
MSDISELEERITSALERIGRAVSVAEERAAAAPEVGGIASDEMEAEIGRLNEALETEKDANAQMEARVKAIHDKQNTHVAALEGEVETLHRQIYDLERAMTGLRHANDTLRANNTALRDANAAGVGDADLINAALSADVQALEQVRATERVALDGLISDLKAALPHDVVAAETKEL